MTALARVTGPGRFSLRRLRAVLRGGDRVRRRAGAARSLPGMLMLGHSHALSGGVAALAAGIFLHLPIPQIGALAGFTAGMALLPE